MMRKLSVPLLAAVLMSAVCVAQSTPDPQSNVPAAQNASPGQATPDMQNPQAPSSAPAAGPTAQSGTQTGGMHFAGGTIIPAELNKSIDAKKAKSGDPVMAKVSQDLLSNGQIVIPRGAKIMGHVTEAQGGKKGESSSLGIAFDKIVMKDGKEVPLQATIQAMARPQQSAALAAPSDPNAETGAHGSVGIGAGGAGRNPVGSGAPGTEAPGVPPQDNTGTANPQASGVSLNAGSQGAIGMEGITLSANGQTTMVNSTKSDVKLDGGTQLILRTL